MTSYLLPIWKEYCRLFLTIYIYFFFSEDILSETIVLQNLLEMKSSGGKLWEMSILPE